MLKVITPNFVSNKKVLLRYDIDVPIKEGKVVEDFRLEAGLETLDMCLKYASSVILMGHIGRPEGEDSKYSVAPIVDWFEERFSGINLPAGKFHILENLRFEKGEDECNLDFAKELATYGDVFINEAFAAHHKSASTTVLPALLPSVAGLNFAEEVEELSHLRKNPIKPYVAIIGGVKIEDKLPAVLSLSKVADTVLVGGRLAFEIHSKATLGQIDPLPENVHLAKLSMDGTDIAPDTLDNWKADLQKAKTILWNGPMGQYEDPKNGQTKVLAEYLATLSAEKILGGGDTVSAVDQFRLLKRFSFVSTGGGAMLKFLIDGTLPTIDVLQ